MSKEEALRLCRFGTVGVSVALLYVLLYWGQVTFGVVQGVANFVAFAVAVLVQYVAQTLWTFRRPLAVPDQAFRFSTTIGIGFGVSALITGWIGPSFGWADWQAAAVVAVVLPVQNYIIFRVWVYARPES